MKEQALNNALSTIENLLEGFYVLKIIIFLLIILWGIFSLWQEIKNLKAAQENREKFIFKTSLTIGGHILLISSVIIFSSLGINLVALDLFFRVATIVLAGVAFMVAYLNFQRKDGIDIQGGFILPQGIIENKETQVVELLLLNLKDKAETVFAIYIEDSGGKKYRIYDMGVNRPAFILEPFKLFNIEIDKYIQENIEVTTSYSASGQQNPIKSTKVDLYHQLTKKMDKKFKIILSTSNGKFVIGKHINYWYPEGQYVELYEHDGTAPFLINSEL